jgi:hypothetical protein
MTRYIIATIAVFSLTVARDTRAQTVPGSASSRAREIAALFSKNKHVVKEKRGARIEKYKKIYVEPLIAKDPSNYSGSYRAFNSDFVMRLSVSTSGLVEGSGTDAVDFGSSVSRPFVLTDGKVDRGVLTATKVYRDGRRERIEGGFMDRTSFESPADKGVTVFGLGVIAKPMQIGGNNVDRLFYERASGEMAQGDTGNH